MVVGNGMKCTGPRKLSALPASGEMHHKRNFRMAAATCAFFCRVETIAYS